MRKKFAGLVAASVMTVWAGAANAAPIVFTTSGNNGVSGKATFEFSSNSFTLTLENLTGPISLTAQELDGISFRLAGGGTAATTGATVQGIINCAGDHSYPCANYAGLIAPNYGWQLSTSAGLSTFSPNGYKPYAIINENYQLPAQGNGNLANGPHNPFLIGPVVFTFSGAFTGVSDVNFFWGTQPYITEGVCIDCPITGTDTVPTPEPTSLLLLGTGLLAVTRRARSRQQ